MLQFTQDQIAQGDAFGMTEGTDYTIVEGSFNLDEEDEGELDVDRSALGVPQLEGDGGKPPASASPEGEGEGDGKQEGEGDGAADGEGSNDGEGEGDGKKAEGAEGAADDSGAAAGKDAAASADDDAADDGANAGADDDDASGLRIPKYRYDQQRARSQRLEQENRDLMEKLAAAEKGAPAPAAAPAEAPAKPEAPAEPEGPTREQQLLEERFDALLEKKNTALIDGDAKEASAHEKELLKVQRELDALSRPAPAPAKPEFDPAAERQRIKDEVRAEAALDATIDSLIADYDVLNEASDTYDQKVVDRVSRLQRLNAEDGMSLIEALVEAADTVLVGHTPRSKQKAAEPVQAKKTDVKKNLDTARRQPASLNEDLGSNSDSGGLTEDLPDMDKITDEEFDKLPKHIQDRMAGSVIA